MNNHQQAPITNLSPGLANRVQEALGQNVYLCYQCNRCSSGCPLGEFFDLQPNQILRALQLGQEEIVFNAQTPWLCAACQTCSTRCPQELDIAGIMEFLAREALEHGYRPPLPEINVFNQAFLREVRLWGRAYELGLLAEMKMRTGDLTSDLDLGIKMLRKNKFKFFPSPVRRKRKVRPVAASRDTLAYYPGCSLHSTASEFDQSARAVCSALDIQLFEPEGWVCCGSTAAHRSDPELAYDLPLENLTIIAQSGFETVAMPCAACFNRHKVALHALHTQTPGQSLAGQPLPGQSLPKPPVSTGDPAEVKVLTLIDAILEHAGAPGVSQRVEHSLDGLNVVCYYGCLLTRPPEVSEAEHPENPINMDCLMGALGADVLDWSYKTVCCGAAHSLIRPEIVLKLSGSLIHHAQEAGADAIVVACPLCHMNLDARQFQMQLDEPMPILYFTQIMAIAFGLPAKAAALHKNLVDPRPVLRARGIPVPA